MSLRRRCLSIAILAAVAGRASADPDPEVRALVDRAQRHYDLGEYEQAMEGFRAAYRADPRPALLYNVAQAARLGGQCATAAAMYRSFVREAPASEYRALAEQHLSELRCVSEHAEPVRTATLTTPNVERGGGRNLRRCGLVIAATGVAALATGAYFGWDASRAGHEVSEGYERGASWAQLDAIDARGRRSELVGGVLITTGVTAAATGAVLYLLGRRAERVSLRPRSNGVEAAVSWSF